MVKLTTVNDIDYILTSHKDVVHGIYTLNKFDIGNDQRLIRAKILTNARTGRCKTPINNNNKNDNDDKQTRHNRIECAKAIEHNLDDSKTQLI